MTLSTDYSRCTLLTGAIGLCCCSILALLTLGLRGIPGAESTIRQAFDHPGVEQIVFIDAMIPDWEFLTRQIAANSKVNPKIVKLNTNAGDTLTHMTQTLAVYTRLKAIHLITHGSAGRLQLGTDSIDEPQLNRYQDQVMQWRDALRQDADILIYGCEVAAQSQGLSFLERLHELTQADIQASNDLTGSPQLGGNWHLEVSIGSIETPLAISPQIQSTYSGVLQQLHVTTTQDAGTGSLRWAITQANQTPEDDLIDLIQVSGVITLQSSLPAITSNLSIGGDGNDRISGDNSHRVFYVDRGDVVMNHLTIANGLAQGNKGEQGGGGAAGMGGGLLINRGTVTLSHVQFVNNQAIGGSGSNHPKFGQRQPTIATPIATQIQSGKSNFEVNRGAIIGINGISLNSLHPDEIGAIPVRIDSDHDKFRANRGAIAGVNGIGFGGIGSIAFGGGGGFGGFGNAGNGGNGGNAGANGGNGGDGGDGGDGGVGIFGDFGLWAGQGGMGTIAFGGGGGFGGFGNAGNGGNGGNAAIEIARGGNGGNGGNGGFGGGGGAAGFGGTGGTGGGAGQSGLPGQGGFGGSTGGLGYGGSGAGLGGAIFIRAGSLVLSDTRFERNAAIGGIGITPGQGKGGAIFVVTPELESQAGIATAPSVVSLGQPPEFIDNFASDPGNTWTDNADMYGVICME